MSSHLTDTQFRTILTIINNGVLTLKYEPEETGGEHVEREAHRHLQYRAEVAEVDVGHDVGEGR